MREPSSLVAPGIAKRRVIVARLGDSSSMCALRDGRSVECIPARYAFGPLPADDFASEIDPDIAQLLRSENGMPTEALQDASRRSYGLSGPAGAGEVAFELEGARSPQVRHAVERLGYRAGLDAGLLAAALEGLDAFVFTGEIGERSAAIRASIAERLSWLGATLDAPANAQHARLISRHDGRIPIYVLPSDDELTIARHTLAILLNGPSPH
ncbi:acetate kinase [Bradyrhizobium sp. LB9.1b]